MQRGERNAKLGWWGLLLAVMGGACSTVEPARAPEVEAPAPKEPARPEPEFGAPAHGDLLPGETCAEEPVPGWLKDGDKKSLRLTQGKFVLPVPDKWKVRIDRPDLAVMWAPESTRGVRPVFEVFVSPICDKYQMKTLYYRVAVRGMMELLSPKDALAQVSAGKWSIGAGGPTGTSLAVLDVLMKTKEGDRNLILYATDFAKGPTFGIRAAAVCPKEPGVKEMGPCEMTYFSMLDAAKTDG